MGMRSRAAIHGAGDVDPGDVDPGTLTWGDVATLVETIRGRRLEWPIKRPFTVNCDEARPAAPQVPDRPRYPQVACPKPATSPAVNTVGLFVGALPGSGPKKQVASR